LPKEISVVSIHAVEIDADSAQQSKENIAASPSPSRIEKVF
jgi:tRNA1(Val) A37 N6-methylase TrmN6